MDDDSDSCWAVDEASGLLVVERGEMRDVRPVGAEDAEDLGVLSAGSRCAM
jgi:hypothetical protein